MYLIQCIKYFVSYRDVRKCSSHRDIGKCSSECNFGNVSHNEMYGIMFYFLDNDLYFF
jgi:hypothetical protein